MALSIKSQDPYFVGGHRAYDIADRYWHVYQTKLYDNISVRKFPIGNKLDSLNNLKSRIVSSIDSQDADFLFKEYVELPESNNSRKGIWQHLFNNPAYAFSHKSNTFEFHLNGILNFQAGNESEESEFIFQNTRGIELWGRLDDKFYFYTSLYENQANFLNYIERSINQYQAIPRQGHYKPYQSSVIDAFQGYDFANAIAYLGYSTSKHTQLELGYGRHFMGNGIRSLLLNDFSHNYLYLNFSVDVWRLHYQSMVAELRPISSIQTVGNTVLPRKYMAVHYLSLDLGKRFEIGLYEAVVFARQDQFEFQYLNPLILYRTAEALIDSPDNVLLGLNFNWLFMDRTSLYGQLLIDELRTSEIFSGNGWWGNKWAYQFGLKHYDLFKISNLDLHLEYNKVRPYTYTHNSTLNGFPSLSSSSFSHFNQPLAHPLGANFSEVIVRLRFRPVYRLFLNAQYIYTRLGQSPDDQNYGQNILLNNNSRVADFGVNHLQGNKTNISNFDLQISYMFTHDLYIDLLARYRRESDASNSGLNTSYLGLGLRYNIENRNIDY